MARIMIVDDHDVVRSGLRAILETQDGWEVVGEAGDGRQAVAIALQTSPDIVVVDYALPSWNGIEVARQIRLRLPSTEILMFTMHDADDIVRELLATGVRGYLLKSDARKLLITAIETLLDHKPFFTGKVSEAVLQAYIDKNRQEGVLSSKERGVVQLIAEGHTNKSAADVLSVSTKTVESHRAAAMRKLKLLSTADLVRYAVRNRLIDP